MKTNVSSVWFIGLVITFLMIFSAYIIITTDYSKSFKLKNEVLSIIENNKGMTFYAYGTDAVSTIDKSTTVVTKIGAIRTINAYLKTHNYDAKGPCNIPAGVKYIYGVKELEYENGHDINSFVELVTNTSKHYYYCFGKFPTGNDTYVEYNPVYYSVELFYKFEIPILREFLPIRVEGVTDEIYRPDEKNEKFTCSVASMKGYCKNPKDYFLSFGV